jgi:hypothetical protein
LFLLYYSFNFFAITIENTTSGGGDTMAISNKKIFEFNGNCGRLRFDKLGLR